MFKLFTKISRMTGRGLALQECLYGFIMALLFVSAALFGIISVSDRGEIIILILGMNFSWGVIDMIIYYLVDISEQKKFIRILNNEGLYDTKKKVIKDNLSGTILALLDECDEDRIIDEIMKSGMESHFSIRMERRDLLKSAAMCFVITMLTTIPAIVSILIVLDLRTGLICAAVSSSICMFFVGYSLGPYLGVKGWKAGAFILALTMAITLAATFTGG